ncbi:hypothetical protein [Aliagarivorans marinus]|uniref:hypothetical protein n=1 Tax=Aliagarivorans marinus TaxID=561965 RepID=UPI000421CD96|nr:hypothetical protein [Aliagarivorans marinus]
MKFVIIILISLTTLVAKANENDLITLTGYGATKQDALLDAKSQLASQYLSEVSVTTRSHLSSKDGSSQRSFEQSGYSQSRKIPIPHLEERSVSCQNSESCIIEYALSKSIWISYLEDLVEKEQQQAKTLLTSLRDTRLTWLDISNLQHAQKKLERSDISISLLKVLQNNPLELSKTNRLLEIEIAELVRSVRFNISHDSKPISSKASSAFQSSINSGNPADYFIHFSSRESRGKSGSKYVAKSIVTVKVFSSSALTTPVFTKDYSGVGRSPISYQEAVSTAEQSTINLLIRDLIEKDYQYDQE